ncbi:hypothetical protein ACIQ57_00925 [Lysinibacillus xylanilyticus]|uniref:hypothetical protein n=1 Tax=Lysinibacillus xylanilyticus TaxID=582475 RepID=UPI0037F6A7D1
MIELDLTMQITASFFYWTGKINSEKSRAELQEEVPKAQANAVLVVWGNTTSVKENSVL